MKPSLPVTTYIDIHLRNVKSRGAVILRPHVPASRIMKTYPAKLLILLSLASSLCNGQPVHGTTVVAAFRHDEIAIAADSRVTDDAKKVRPILYCKISRRGNLSFAAADTFADTPNGYNAFTSIRDALRPEKSFSENLALAETALREAFSRELSAIYQRPINMDDPLGLKSSPLLVHIPERDVAFILVGFEGTEPMLAARKLISRAGYLAQSPLFSYPLESEKIFDCPSPSCESLDGLSVQPLGQTFNINALMNVHLYGWLSPVDAARFFVTLEAITSEVVGPPIDILRITKDSICWIQHKKEGEGCETDIPDCPCTSAPLLKPAPAKPSPTPTKPRRTNPRKRP